MKCRVCSTEIPQGKKCCPKCGRVITSAEEQAMINEPVSSIPELETTIVYKPVTDDAAKPTEKTINITDIFSSDPNAPVYTDPHTYDKATADVLEYDRMFMSRSRKQEEEVKAYEPEEEEEEYADPERRINFTVEQEYDDAEENYDDFYDEDSDALYDDEPPARGKVIRDHSRNKPQFNFNVKYLILAIAVIAGLAIIIFGVTQLGKQFGIITTDDEPQSSISSGTLEKPTKKNEAASDEAIDNSYVEQTGVYTVYTEQNNVFVYKSVTDQRIIATIPNKTIIEITEIKDDFGKTTFNNYTGWVKLADLKFTPNETPDAQQETTTAKETESNLEVVEFKTGIYTVTLNGSNTNLNVRSTHSTEGEIIGSLSEGDTVTVEEIKGSWGKIFVDDVDGWVYMEYLK